MVNTYMESTYRVAILTISDAGFAGERQDASGDIISKLIKREGFHETKRDIVPDETALIKSMLTSWCDSGDIDVVLTTGGTGLSPRDVTPEATKAIVDLEAPGIAEAMRIGTLQDTPYAMLSRSVAGIRSGCLVINLPGSPTGVRQCLNVVMPIIPHALQMIRGSHNHSGAT